MVVMNNGDNVTTICPTPVYPLLSIHPSIPAKESIPNIDAGGKQKSSCLFYDMICTSMKQLIPWW